MRHALSILANAIGFVALFGSVGLVGYGAWQPFTNHWEHGLTLIIGAVVLIYVVGGVMSKSEGAREAICEWWEDEATRWRRAYNIGTVLFAGWLLIKGSSDIFHWIFDGSSLVADLVGRDGYEIIEEIAIICIFIFILRMLKAMETGLRSPDHHTGPI